VGSTRPESIICRSNRFAADWDRHRASWTRWLVTGSRPRAKRSISCCSRESDALVAPETSTYSSDRGGASGTDGAGASRKITVTDVGVTLNSGAGLPALCIA